MVFETLSLFMKSVLRWGLNLVIVIGVVLILWPLGQTAFARWNQHELAQEFQAQPAAAPVKKVPVKTQVKSAKSLVERTSATLESKTKPKGKMPKWSLTKLTIPDLNVETYVVQGWEDASLRRGPGHYELSALPGSGNCVIAGHRNVYGSYFADLDRLLPGQMITLQNREGTWNYMVDAVFTASANDFSVVAPPSMGQPAMLTLITCTLPHTPNRIIVRATLAQPSA